MEQGRFNWIANFIWGIADGVLEVRNRRSLFTRDADQGESNTRRVGGECLSRRRPLFYGIPTEWSCR